MKQPLSPIILANRLSSNDILLLSLIAALLVHLTVIFTLHVSTKVTQLKPKVVEISVIHRPLPRLIAPPTNLSPNLTHIKKQPLAAVPEKIPEKTHLPIQHLQPQVVTIPKLKPLLKRNSRRPVVEQISPEPIYSPPPVVVSPTTPEVIAPVIVPEKEIPLPSPAPVIATPAPLPVPPATPESPDNSAESPPEPPPVAIETVDAPTAAATLPIEQTPVALDENTTPSTKKSNRKTDRKLKRASKRRQDTTPPLTVANLEAQITQAGEKFATLAEQPTNKRVKSLHAVGNHNYLARQYISDWQRKVEKIGNLNYPQAAREKDFSATLVMEVGIKGDGSVQSMKIKKSSGNNEVDEAAKNIVQMSMPFAPLPKELEDELDVLVIRRTWQFSDESGMSTH